MKPEKDSIKNIFSSKLKNFEPDLPPSMWEKIDAGLSAQQSEPASKKMRTGKANIYKYTAWIASAAAIIAIALLIFYPQNTSHKPLAINDKPQAGNVDVSSSKNNVPENKRETKAEDRDNNNNNHQTQVQPRSNLSLTQSTRKFIASLGSSPAHSPQKAEEQDQDMQITGSKDNTLAHVPGDDNIFQSQEKVNSISGVESANQSQGKAYIAENTDVPGQTPPKQEVSEEELAEKIAALVAESQRGEKLLADNNMPGHKKEKKKNNDSPSKGFQIGAGGGGAFSKANGEQMQLRKVNFLYSGIANTNGDASIPVSDAGIIQEANLYQRQEMKMEHNQPVSFGISVSKNISNRVSLETGIVYTYVSSKYLSDKKSDLQANDSQYFHYLGVPLSVNYRIFEWNKLQVYVSAGGLVQKDIYGKMRTSQNVPVLENARESESNTISQDHPQFSLNSSLGLSYPLYRKVGRKSI